MMGKRRKGKGSLVAILLCAVFLPAFVLSCGGGDGGGGSSPPATVADFSASPTSGTAPLAVAFTDNSAGAPTSWSWDFGDNSALDNTQNPHHTYSAAGTYDVTLTADGPGGTDTVTKTGYITVTAPPPPPTVAQFTGDPLSGDAPLDVQFTDTSTGNPTSWSWDFGDNTALGNTQDPLHTYSAAGNYTVTLTANGPGGLNSVTKTDYISVSTPPPAPVAGFYADNTTPTTGIAALTVAFIDNSTGPIDTYSWDFGDGSPLLVGTNTHPSHTYNDAGTYDVTLEVSGPGGTDTETKTGYVIVTPRVFTDNFDRVDGAVGAPWVTAPGQDNVIIQDNVLVGAPSLDNSAGAYYNAAFNDNQYSQARIAGMSQVGVTVRVDPTVESFYRFQITGPNSARLDKWVGGVNSLIDNNATGPYGVDNVIRLEVSGSTLHAYVDNTVVFTATDNTLTGGYPGVRFFYGEPTGALDDWEGGSLP